MARKNMWCMLRMCVFVFWGKGLGSESLLVPNAPQIEQQNNFDFCMDFLAQFSHHVPAESEMKDS